MKNSQTIPDFHYFAEQILLHARLGIEQGSTRTTPVVNRIQKAMQRAVTELQRTTPAYTLAAAEPNELAAIHKLRPKGPRRFWDAVDSKVYAEKVEGALLGRLAGCTLGAPVELWSIEGMQAQAQANGDVFPPTDYWSDVTEPWRLRYGASRASEYLRDEMDGVPVDDDIVYTLLGLLVLEEYGPKFTLDQLGKAWLKLVPLACTAEDVTLRNLREGVPASRAGGKNNPFCEWIGAAIRADAFGYAAAGWPERAAELAWRDARLTHRRNGIYGEMFWAAVIAGAFAVDDPLEAVKIGLSEIPAKCRLAEAIRWALRTAPKIRNYRAARAAVDKQFPHMHPVHTINNACLTVFGLAIGGTDLTRVISETVAMGLDNDCTAATAGSVVGAIIGKRGVPKHWYRRFNNTVHSYLIRKKKFRIDDLVRRFGRVAQDVYRIAPQNGARQKP